jgi:RHS repeat-associated protein
LRNPLREICTAGSVRGETSVGHGGPKRARSRKRWKEAKGSLQPTQSPLLGGYGDPDTYLYDNNTSCSGTLVTGRMTSYNFSIGATPTTFAGSLTWNANGSLRGLATVDGINSGSETETCAYGTSSSAGYDEFGRLLQVNCVNGSTNVWNQTFSYDIYNNVTKSVPSGGTGITWAPGYSATNNQYTLSGTSYDSNGNLLTDTFHTYTWNQDNHPLAMTDSGITMVYDAFGRMVEKATGSTYQQTLISPIGPVALMAKQNLVQYRMPLPGGDIDVTGINFYHKDYLGSVPLVSSRGGRASVAARLFAPYGESYNNDGIAGDLNFSGDYQDLVAGTYDTPNRELNPSQGRWISPDPAHSGWNAYSYTTNPLAETDPSGLYINTWSYCKNTATCNADDGGNGGGGGGSGASQASLAGFGDSYYIDGMQVSGMVAGSLLGMDAAAVCPSSCSGFSNTGQYVQYVASAGLGAQGYVNFSDLTQGLYDDNGTFYTPSQWNTYQNQISLAQELGQYNRLSANLPDGGSIPPFNTNIPVVDGGHANFPYTCQAGFNCGPGRYPNGVHVECASGGYNCSAGSPLVAHDDTVSPWTGSFQFQDVFSANFWEHGFIDLFYGQFCNCVFPY